MEKPLPLVLASSSPYRKALLEQLQLDFICASPDIDESRSEEEPIEDMVMRLSEQKARAVAVEHPESLIIGSDQSAMIEGIILTKPGDRTNAVRQLRAASGKKVTFHTGLCLHNSKTKVSQTACIPFSVVFKELDDRMIESYLDKEEPYNCVGSFKSEGLGIALFDRFEGDDPNALVGLPLIQLSKFLSNEGFEILA